MSLDHSVGAVYAANKSALSSFAAYTAPTNARQLDSGHGGYFQAVQTNSSPSREFEMFKQLLIVNAVCLALLSAPSMAAEAVAKPAETTAKPAAKGKIIFDAFFQQGICETVIKV